MYFEPQQGGLCRVHATNMLLQERRFREADLFALGRRFAARYALPGDGVEHDHGTEDGLILPGYMLECARPDWTTLLLAPGSERLLGMSALDFADRHGDADTPGALVCNAGHVWSVLRRSPDESYLMDSLRGGPQPLGRWNLRRAATGAWAVVMVYGSPAATRRTLLPVLRAALLRSLPSEAWPEWGRRRREATRLESETRCARTSAVVLLGELGLLAACLVRILHRCGEAPRAALAARAMREAYGLAASDPAEFAARVGPVIASLAVRVDPSPEAFPAPPLEAEAEAEAEAAGSASSR